MDSRSYCILLTGEYVYKEIETLLYLKKYVSVFFNIRLLIITETIILVTKLMILDWVTGRF